MKKALSIVISLVGLGMVLSGCVAGAFKNTYVKDRYIQKYITTHANIKPKKTGDNNITFYVGKVKDDRGDHKYVWQKKGPFSIPTAKTYVDNITLTIRNITKRALKDTGWGVSDDSTKADYVIDTDLKEFGTYKGFFVGHYETSSVLNVYSKGKNKLIIKKHINKHVPVLIGGFDLSAQFKISAGKVATQYYRLLVDYFSSNSFKNAIMRDYFSRQDNSTKTKE